jgi:hypothetical protein
MTFQIISDCDNILSELSKFSNEILFLGEPIADQRIVEFEKQIGFKLSPDFKYILTKHNSFSLSGTEVLGLDKKLRGSSLDSVYFFEHGEVGNAMPKEFSPFSPDGAGNHYCLDLSRLEDNLCPVVFWQRDYLYLDKEDVETCYNNFIEWIKEVMIEWTLEDTNYDGSKK